MAIASSRPAKARYGQKDLQNRTGRSKESQADLDRQLGRTPSSQQALEQQMGRDWRSRQRLAESTGALQQPKGIGGRLAGNLDRSIQNYDSRQGTAGARQMGGAKGAAVKTLAGGGSAKEAGKAAAAAALEAKKIQRYRQLLMVLRGVKIGASATLVGIIITVAIWLVQIVLSKVFGMKEFELAGWEKIIAYPIFFLLIIALIMEIAMIAAIFYYYKYYYKFIFDTVVNVFS